MATINTSYPSLLDVAKRTDPSGKIATIVEALQTDCPLIQDMPWKETNGTDGHLVTTRTGLPALTWRKYNSGATTTKSSTAQFTETCGMLDGISKVDVALANRNGNAAAFRHSEDLAFVNSYKRSLEYSFFYASQKTDPEQITGLTPRLDALTGIPYSSQVLAYDGSASGSDQASIWLVGWGQNTVYGIYPKGSQAGLQMKDMGEELVSDGAGGEFRAYRSYFSWNCGLCVEDARYLVRICNIDQTNLALTGSTLIQKMLQATEQIQSLEGVKPVFYMNRKIRTYLRSQMVDTVKNSTLTFENVGGRPVMSFMGIPIHRSDALSITEATVA